MQKHVISEVGLFAESPLTDVALEGPTSVVYVHMRLEVTGCRERLGAHCTFVRFFLEDWGKVVSR